MDRRIRKATVPVCGGVVALAVVATACGGAVSVQPISSPSVVSAPALGASPGAASAPSARGYAGMVDIPGPGVLLGGGAAGPGTAGLADTWMFDGDEGWRKLTAPGGPDFAESMAYHPPTGLVAFIGELWVYDVAEASWAARPHDDGPDDGFGPRICYDVESDRMIVFGGWMG